MPETEAEKIARLKSEIWALDELRSAKKAELATITGEQPLVALTLEPTPPYGIDPSSGHRIQQDLPLV